MSDNPLEKHFPIVFWAIHLIVSEASSEIGLPLARMAGYSWESRGFALLGAAVGIIIGLQPISRSKRWAYSVLALIVSVTSAVVYGSLAFRGGASLPEVIIIFLIYCCFYISSIYVLVSLELAMRDWRAQMQLERRSIGRGGGITNTARSEQRGTDRGNAGQAETSAGSTEGPTGHKKKE